MPPPPDADRPLDPATVVVVAGRPAQSPDAPLSAPVVPASTFHAGGERAYGRHSNPTWEAFEEALGVLEGGRAVAFSSGMGAVSAVLDTLPLGAVVVAPLHAYNETLLTLRQRHERGALVVRPVDVTDAGTVTAAVEGAQLLWLESPSNPMIEVVDVRACADAARAVGATTVVDSTFATPLLQNPLSLGADVVVHSVTKYLAGHSDLLMGAVVVRAGDPWEDALRGRRESGGAIPGAFDAYLALRGLRTLHLRLHRAQASAGVLAERLAGHPAVERVRYPGLGGTHGHDLATRQMRGYGAMIAVDVRGGAEAAEAFAEGCRLWVHATSLGGVESTLERRRRWPAEPTTVPEGLVRLSVGIEDVEDLWADLSRSLDRVGRPDL
ncbi:MAG TPA: PLP-dependent transferase [Jiangellales bacterium]|nr:PLP-dependent transferase [Jiangellales bacterium]